MASMGEISEELPIQIDDRLFVAVGKELNKSKLTLLWALHNSGGRRICILHVHQPAQWIPLMGTKFHVSKLGEHQVREYRETERQAMNKLLQNYVLICEKAGMQANTLYIETNSVEKGIVELITQYGIMKLVMGAAADTHYSKKMMQPKSKTAIYVREQAPCTCHIWFICKGHIVHTREGKLDRVNVAISSPNLQESPKGGTVQSRFLRSQSVIEGANEQLGLIYLGSGYPRAKSEITRLENLNLSSSSSDGATPSVNSSADGIPILSAPSIDYLKSSASDVAYRSSLISNSVAESGLNSHDLRYQQLSLPSVLDTVMNDELYAQLEKAMSEADNSKREAFEESLRRRKAEKDVVDAIRRVKATENLYYEELRRRKQNEESLVIGYKEIEKMKLQSDDIMCEAREQKASLETKIANSQVMVQELEQQMFSAVELLQKYKKKIDELKIERNDALKVAEELRRIQADKVTMSTFQDLLYPTAGDWPFVQAKQLAHLGMRCREMDTKSRPDLSSEVSSALDTMRFSRGGSSIRLSSEEHPQIPHYFVCPILQKIMEDPHVAADGFTYELEALKGWLDSGHYTSPITNLPLPHHNLVPNRALCSAIQKWKQKK